MIRLNSFWGYMLMKLKEEFGRHKVGVIMGSVLILGIIAYISRKRTTASTSQKFLSYSATNQETSIKETAQKRENWAKDFSLQLLTRASFLELLRSLNKTLINSLVNST